MISSDHSHTFARIVQLFLRLYSCRLRCNHVEFLVLDTSHISYISHLPSITKLCKHASFEFLRWFEISYMFENFRTIPLFEINEFGSKLTTWNNFNFLQVSILYSVNNPLCLNSCNYHHMASLLQFHKRFTCIVTLYLNHACYWDSATTVA